MNKNNLNKIYKNKIMFKYSFIGLFIFVMIFTAGSVCAQDAARANSQALADWTVLSYLAADNSLERNALADINEMEQAGPAPNINIIIQLDRSENGYNDGVNAWNEAVRIKIVKDNDNQKINSPIIAKLGNVNSGDSKNLTEFIEWGIKNYPAKRYALVVWSHGSGWKTIPYDGVVEENGGKSKTKSRRLKYLENLAKQPEHFMNNLNDRKIKSVRKVAAQFATAINFDFNDMQMQKTIAYDDSSCDSITLNELHDAIKSGASNAGLVNGFDIIWFDACLMSMFEVACSISDCGQYMIASEETTPEFGWNHVKIVNALNKAGALQTSDVAKLIAGKFIDSYNKPDSTSESPFGQADYLPVTMNAIDLKKTDRMIAVLNEFVTLAKDPALIPAVYNSLKIVQRFDDPDYVDLFNFMQVLNNSVSSPALDNCFKNFKQAFGELVILNKKNAQQFKNACGLSIYFPAQEYNKDYEELVFSQKCHWLEFIKNYFYPAASEIIVCTNSYINNANNDGLIVPNDNFELRAAVLNTGNVASGNCKLSVKTKSKGIKILNGDCALNSIGPSNYAEGVFKMSSTAVKENDAVSFDLFYEGADGVSVKIAKLDYIVKAPFMKKSNALVILGHSDEAVTNAINTAFETAGIKFDLWSTDNDGQVTLAVLKKYLNGGVVFKIVPDSSEQNKMVMAELAILQEFLMSGGSLFLCGQDVGAMIGSTDFYKNYLKCSFVSDDGGSGAIKGNGKFDGESYTLNGSDSANNQLFIDEISPLKGAEVIFNYDNNKTAGIFADTQKYRLIYLGFGLEAVSTAAARAEIVKKAMAILPFNLQAAVENMQKVSVAVKAQADSSADGPENNMEKASEVAVSTNQRAASNVINDLNGGNYQSAFELCDRLSGEGDARVKQSFKPVLKEISEFLRSKLMQRDSLNAEEQKQLEALLNRIESIK
ncbi:MAG: clostripain-related cysteine peptidase [Candidatus Wallbacteria bacterium]